MYKKSLKHKAKNKEADEVKEEKFHKHGKKYDVQEEVEKLLPESEVKGQFYGPLPKELMQKELLLINEKLRTGIYVGPELEILKRRAEELESRIRKEPV